MTTVILILAAIVAGLYLFAGFCLAMRIRYCDHWLATLLIAILWGPILIGARIKEAITRENYKENP